MEQHIQSNEHKKTPDNVEGSYIIIRDQLIKPHLLLQNQNLQLPHGANGFLLGKDL